MTSPIRSARIGVAVLLLAIIVVLWPNGGRAEALGQGCPPQSSVCNPVGLALMAGDATAGYEFAEALDSHVSPGTVVSTTGTATTGTVARTPRVSRGGLILNAVAAVSVLGMIAGEFLWGEEPPPEITMDPGLPAGWVGGIDTGLLRNNTHNRDVWIQVQVFSTPNYDTTGTVSLAYRCFNRSAGGTASLPAWKLRFTNDGAEVVGSTSTNCVDTGSGFAPGPWGYVNYATGTKRFDGIEVGEAWYWPVGYVGRFAGTEGNTGTVTSTIQCGTGPGDLHFVSLSEVATYEPGTEFEYPAPQCPDGEVVFGYGVTWDAGDGPEDIVPWTTTPEWVQDIPTEWPGCLEAVCELTLWQIAGTGPDNYCGVAAVGCPTWYVDPDNTTNYECRWGPYVVDLGYCNVFRNPGRVTPNVPLVEDPVNDQQHSVGAGPDTSLDLPGSAYDPEGTPEVDPSLPVPDWSAPTGPAGQTGECFPTGWGVFNPAEWVLKPVKCALLWAFVPRSTVVTQTVTDTRAALDADPVLGTVPALVDVGLAAPDAIATPGCSGGVTIGGPFEGHDLSFDIPCDPGDVIGESQWGLVYSFQVVMLSAGIAFAVFHMVRPYFVSKSAD